MNLDLGGEVPLHRLKNASIEYSSMYRWAGAVWAFLEDDVLDQIDGALDIPIVVTFIPDINNLLEAV
jgi:hypothetical protein